MKMRLPSQLALVIIGLGFMWQPAQAQTFSVLYNFGTNSGDPLNPGETGAIAQGRDGNLYSTASNGGAHGYGAVFKITPSGKLTVLYNFDGPHGQAPLGGLTLGTDGNFYGTTWYGGATGNGTVFKITPTGQLTVLYSFTGGSDGFQPYAPPIEGSDGNFYGTAGFGGAGWGTVYKLTPSGKFTTLHAFSSGDGSSPIAPLVQGIDGSFYGTAELGGSVNDGVLFTVKSSGNLAVIASFDGAGNGANPYSPVIQANDGNFYGTASTWGSFEWGTIYKTTAKGDLTVLYNFNGSSDGGDPLAGLMQGTDGKFYGAATGDFFTNDYGTVFSITPSGAFSVLHSFDGSHGANPCVTPVQHTSGILYGDTVNGGTASSGTFYSLRVGLKPFVSLLPYSGKVGKTIEFLGQGFTGTTAVSFNGTAASFIVKSSTYLTAVVPTGATTGFVTVTTPKGKLTSNKKFRVN
jgi:uncharacterized repeat protein (TIGR03803 family)